MTVGDLLAALVALTEPLRTSGDRGDALSPRSHSAKEQR